MKKIFGVLFCLMAGQAAANDCNVTIEATDSMKYNMAEINVPASCGDVTLTLKHVGSLPRNVMGHNWVLTKAADATAVQNASMAAGLANEYVPAGSPKVLAATKVIGGGQVDTITFNVADLKGQDLSFFCSFPGHWAIMKGKLTVS